MILIEALKILESALFCTKCGAKLDSGATFCRQCGGKILGKASNALYINETVYSPNKEDGQKVSRQEGYRRKSALYIVLGALIIILGIVVVSFPYVKRIPLNRSLSMGDKYLSELRYEDAIAAYKRAIEINPRSPDGYTKLSDVYIRLANEYLEEDHSLAEEYLGLALDLLEEAVYNVDISDRGKIQKTVEEIEESDIYKTINNIQEEDEPDDNYLEAVSGIVDIPYKGNGNYELRYYPVNDMQWGMTYPDDEERLLSTWSGDLDNDRDTEALAVVLRQNGAGDSIIELNILEQLNGSWVINAELTIPVRLMDVVLTKGRFDLFTKECGEKNILFFERAEFANRFGDGNSYGLYSWYYDGSDLQEEYDPIEADGSDGLIEGLLAMTMDYVFDYFEEDGALLEQYFDEIHEMGFLPSKLGVDAPIWDTADNVEKIVRIERTDDSEDWEYDFDSPYLYVLDSDGFLGHISIRIWDYINSDEMEVQTENETQGGELQEDGTVETDEYIILYRTVLENYHSENEYENPGFSLIYIDDDEIPELAIADGSHHVDKVSVYTVYGGKAIEVGEYGSNGEIEYLERGNVIHSNWTGMGAALDDYYSINAGNESEICSLTSEENPLNIGEYSYTIDDNDVSEEEYNRRLLGMQRNYSLCSFDNMYEINGDMINLYL